MTLSAIMAISPLEGRYAEKVADLRPLLSEYGLIKFRVLVEIRWLQLLLAEANLPELPKASAKIHALLDNITNHFSESDAERVKEIESGINHDVKAVEYFIKEYIENQPDLASMHEFIHFGCTSEDINNLAYALMLQAARDNIMLPALDKILKLLTALAHDHADVVMLSHTHGQPATPTTVGKEMANVIARLQRQIDQLAHTPILGKLNGASGNYNALAVAYPEINWQKLSKKTGDQSGINLEPIHDTN